VKARLNILISGGTGSGKTTILNLLSGCIPSGERIVTIEDSAELQIQKPHVIRLESRPPNIEGAGEVTLRDLVKNSLRMRPDRIIVGEVRGSEALDMLQAMNTGHEGSMSTIHANSPRDAFSRLGVMVRMGSVQISDRALGYMMTSPINIIVHLSRLPNGKRKVMSISEVAGLEGETISLQDIFVFEQKGVKSDGEVFGEFKATGIGTKFYERIARSGTHLDPAIFRFTRTVGG
jgi:pilus assembly protein CpaF